jgi:hypothetical protein
MEFCAQLLIVIEKARTGAARTTRLNYLFRERYIKQKREIKYRLQRFGFARYPLPHFISFHFAYSDHFLVRIFFMIGQLPSLTFSNKLTHKIRYHAA